jgi:hypothetical protein
MAKAEPQCIITGCGLVQNNAWSWGDLHEFGGLWIFHGASHATDWLSYDAAVRQSQERCLILESDAKFFCRRGIFVIAKTGTRLNGRARDYLNEGEKK